MGLASAISEIADRSGNSFSCPGVWTARVEDINDPKRIGRIRVRIFQKHGDKRSTPTTALPWAEVADVGGGGYDYGSAGSVYPVGSTVWVVFNSGDDRFPVVIGGRRGTVKRGVPGDQVANPVEFLTTDGTTYDGITSPWSPPEGNETPKDVFSDSADGDLLPTRTVWHKSFKGHTIVVEDRDEHEFLQIIDRAGQVIEMSCPVTAESNANNGVQRGTSNALDESQLSQSALVNSRAYVRIKDVAGQEIILDGVDGSENITLRSKSSAGAAEQTIVLSSAKGQESISITDKNGNTFTLSPNNVTETISIKDSSGNQIAFNVEGGQLIFNANTEEMHNVGALTNNVAGDKIDAVGGSIKSKVGGNSFLDVMNDLAATVGGLCNLMLSGPVSVSVSNTSASGAPATTALDVTLALGAFGVSSQLNADPMSISTLAGDLEFKTIAGNVTMKTMAGLADFGTMAGSTTIHGSVGIALGDGASHSIAYGDALITALTPFLTALTSDIRTGYVGFPVIPSPGLLSAIASLMGQLSPGVICSLLNTTV